MPISADVAKMREQHEQLLIMAFLSSLRSEHDSVRSQILASKEASLTEAFSRANRAIRPSSDSSPFSGDRAALASSGRPRGRGRGRGGDRPFCTLCQRRGHIIQTCYQLHGRPSSTTTSTPDGQPICTHCKAPGHTRDRCFKLHGRSSASQSANVTSSGKDTFHPPDDDSSHSHAQTSTAPLVHSAHSAAYLSSSPRHWIIDTGASDHTTSSLGMMCDFSPTSSYLDVRIADGTYIPVKGIGTVTLTCTLTLSSVLYIPTLSVNLLSVSALTQTHRCHALFSGNSYTFQDPVTRRTIGRGRCLLGGLYVFEVESPSVAFPSISTTALDLHCRFGHPTLSSLKRLCPEVQSLSDLFCESCQFAKHHRISYKSRVTKRAFVPFELMHSDVWGLCLVESKAGFRYFVSFVNDYFRMTWLFLMKNRSELFSIFTVFHAEIQTQFSLPIRTFRSDNASEYFSHSFTTFMATHGILHESSCPDTPSQNGVTERKNRHLLEVTKALMFRMHVPKMFWSEPVLTAAYLINRMPSSILQGEIPLRALFPNTSLHPFHPLPLRIFGCTCYVRDIRPTLTKLDLKSLRCIFLGYSRTQKGNRCYSPGLRRFCVSADVTFDESTPFFSPSAKSSSCLPRPSQPESITDDDDILVYESNERLSELPAPVSPPSSASPPPPSSPPLPIHHVYTRGPRRVISYGTDLPLVQLDSPPVTAPEPTPVDPSSSPMDSTPPASSSDLDAHITLRKGHRSCATYALSTYISYVGASPTLQAFIFALNSVPVPRSVSEALSSSVWTQAMSEEMTVLEANETWDLVSLPPEKTAIGYK
ncbi:hypothetical protein Dimus_039121 [Dionaea muscipula]